jgi:UDP-N-acetylmuramoyl-L-alanyl-D-glutamate--2,6-diaminopimelate ligase
MMRLETILEFAGLKERARDWEAVRALEVSGVTYDSRRVAAGDLFVAISGEQSDGHEFVSDAASAGAVAALVEHAVDHPLPQIRVEDTRWSLGPVSAAVYGNPGERLFTVGVTGTNGKTTTAHLIQSLLESGGERAGMIGTVTYRVGGNERDAPYTTPESTDLQAMLAEMLAAGDPSVVLEVSSHALALGRIEGLAFDVACFTNLGRDHLDFHDSMDDYRAVKTTLFTGYRKPGGTAVVNVDDTTGERLAGTLDDPVLRVGMTRTADVTATELEVGQEGLRLRLQYGGSAADIQSPLLGLLNVPNLLVAAAVGMVAGFPVSRTAEALSAAGSVPGRMERLDGPPGVAVVLDYAHKPEALRGALQACRDLTPGRVIVVFGCGGDRDRGKRPLMGRIAALGADIVLVTSDNPRTEDPDAIIEEIVAGIPPEATFQIAPDRRKAIMEALAEARAGDLILIAGKGHEQYQIIGTERLPFDEREAVAEAIAALPQGARQ